MFAFLIFGNTCFAAVELFLCGATTSTVVIIADKCGATTSTVFIAPSECAATTFTVFITPNAFFLPNTCFSMGVMLLGVVGVWCPHGVGKTIERFSGIDVRICCACLCGEGWENLRDRCAHCLSMIVLRFHFAVGLLLVCFCAMK